MMMKMMKLHWTERKVCTRVLLAQVLPGGGNIGHVLVQYVLLGADAVTLNVLRPIQLTHVKVKHLRKAERERVYNRSWL